MTGYGVGGVASRRAGCGARDLHRNGRPRAPDRARHHDPLIADGDTGYGGLLNVELTVRGYEAAGAQAIQIEDQEFPKKCGHTPGRRVIPLEEAARRIKVAVASAIVEGLSDRRAHRCAHVARPRRGAAARRSLSKAGADVLFIESPESEAEMERIGRSFDVPLVANMVEGGRTPILSRARAEAARLQARDLSGLGLSRDGRGVALGLWRNPQQRIDQGLGRRALRLSAISRASWASSGSGRSSGSTWRREDRRSVLIPSSPGTF